MTVQLVNVSIRFLLKMYTAAKQGQKLTGTVAYLSDVGNQKSNLTSGLLPRDLVLAYKHRANRSVIFASFNTTQMAIAKEQVASLFTE